MNYKKFWSNKTTPMQRGDTETHNKVLAIELRSLWRDYFPKTILELGCGNGMFFELLDFDEADRYVGVDFSDQMLSVFSQSYPQAELHQSDAAKYQDNREYDLIFSHGVIQYFSERMLLTQLDIAKQMMHSDSLLVHAGFPWRALRFAYYSLEATQPEKFSWIRGLSSIFRRSRYQMGYWHSMRNLTELADRSGLSVKFYGSSMYTYRLHSVFKLK